MNIRDALIQAKAEGKCAVLWYPAGAATKVRPTEDSYTVTYTMDLHNGLRPATFDNDEFSWHELISEDWRVE